MNLHGFSLTPALRRMSTMGANRAHPAIDRARPEDGSGYPKLCCGSDNPQSGKALTPPTITKQTPGAPVCLSVGHPSTRTIMPTCLRWCCRSRKSNGRLPEAFAVFRSLNKKSQSGRWRQIWNFASMRYPDHLSRSKPRWGSAIQFLRVRLSPCVAKCTDVRCQITGAGRRCPAARL